MAGMDLGQGVGSSRAALPSPAAMTWSPSAAKRPAIAAPIPLVPPVTTTVRPPGPATRSSCTALSSSSDERETLGYEGCRTYADRLSAGPGLPRHPALTSAPPAQPPGPAASTPDAPTPSAATDQPTPFPEGGLRHGYRGSAHPIARAGWGQPGRSRLPFRPPHGRWDGGPCPGRCVQGPPEPCGPVTAQGITTLKPQHPTGPPDASAG